MAYLIQTNIWWLVLALLIGFVVGAWVWARPRHRIALTQTDEDAPAARTLERAPAPPPAPVQTTAPPPVSPAELLAGADEAVLTGGGSSPFLSAPQGDVDDFRRLKGVGPKLNTLLGELGIYHYHQIARWTDGDVTIVDERLGSFKGRIERDRWREQAQLLAEGRFDEFEARFGSDGKKQG